MLGEGAFVPERSMGCMALIYANPYNILCVGIEKASVNKISTNSFKKDNFPVSVYLMPFLRMCLCEVQENEINL